MYRLWIDIKEAMGLWAGCRGCMRTVRRCIPSLLRYSVASLPALLLEEGDLAPHSVKRTAACRPYEFTSDDTTDRDGARRDLRPGRDPVALASAGDVASPESIGLLGDGSPAASLQGGDDLETANRPGDERLPQTANDTATPTGQSTPNEQENSLQPNLSETEPSDEPAQANYGGPASCVCST